MRLVRSDESDHNGLMRKVSVSHAKAHLSELLQAAQRGETVLVVLRGRPVARLVAVVPGVGETDRDRIARLEKAGVLKRSSRWPPSWSSLDKLPFPRLKDGGSLSEEVIRMRREAR